jgi:UDPglucose 6-dehydrogenase
VAHREISRIYGDRADLQLAPDKYAALQGADALVICTEWQQFRAPDFEEMAQRMAGRVIVDGRNIFVPDRMRQMGWTYLSIGRP